MSTAPYNRDSDTSEAAAQSHNERDLDKLRTKVYEYVCSCGEEGATCDEIEVALGLAHQTASARCWELQGKDERHQRPMLIQDLGVRRKTRSGRSAAVLVATKFEKPILFYGALEGYVEFSNFYPSPIRVGKGGRVYPTVEHYYQACKAMTTEECEAIRKASTPAQAKRMGQKVKLWPDWERRKIDVMRLALKKKFTQHRDLKELLLSTGNAVIHENAPRDAIWGWMGGRGQDLLGKLLMECRDRLRSGEYEDA